MDFNFKIEQLTWKKIVIAGLAIVISIVLVRELLLWTFFREATHLFGQFNTQFEQQQKQIHNKIKETESDFDKRHRLFNESFEKGEKMMAEQRQEMTNAMEQLEKSALEREKKFDEFFAKAPQQMLAQHKAMGEKMFDEFVKESRERSHHFQNVVSSDQHRSEKTRCEIALGNRPTNRSAPVGLTPEQQKDRLANLMRIRKEIAVVEHCETYV